MSGLTEAEREALDEALRAGWDGHAITINTVPLEAAVAKIKADAEALVRAETCRSAAEVAETFEGGGQIAACLRVFAEVGSRAALTAEGGEDRDGPEWTEAEVNAYARASMGDPAAERAAVVTEHREHCTAPTCCLAVLDAAEGGEDRG